MNRTALVLILLVAAIVSARFIDAQTQPVAGLTSTAVITGTTGPPSLFANGTAAAPSISFASNPSTGFYLFSSGNLVQDISGANIALWNSSGVVFSSAALMRWANGDALQSVDTALGRNAAGVVEVNTGTAGAVASLTTNSSGLGGGAIILGPASFSGLNVNVPKGTLLYCVDCAPASAIDQTCVGASTGSLAFRVNGLWKCIS